MKSINQRWIYPQGDRLVSGNRLCTEVLARSIVESLLGNTGFEMPTHEFRGGLALVRQQ
jgi:hypothetical protein